MADTQLIVEEINVQVKSQPPLPNFQSLLATVKVFSYLDFADGIEELCQILSKKTQVYWKSQEKILRGALKVDNNRHQNMNLTDLFEFGWEKNKSTEIVHFLSNPPPPLEWSDIYPNDRTFAKMQRIPKSKDVKIKEIVYKTERIYGFLSGI